MHAVDLTIIALYFAAMIVVGLRLARRGSTDLDSYFLGGRRMPWWTLSMSGSVSNFDVTGTMWIVSMIVLLGMRSMWIHWIWGFLAGAFLMVYMGRWVRKSEVMTGAEWMKTRFGDDTGGRSARFTYAAMAVLVTVSAIAYAYQGIGKFMAVYVPLDEWIDPATTWGRFFVEYEADVMAILVIGLTTLYVLFGGLMSVVVTDVVQTIILTVGSIVVGALAWSALTPEKLSVLPADFLSLVPKWRLEFDDPKVSAEYGLFGALVIVWVAKGLLLNIGGPGQLYDFQRFVAARSPRDAAKVGAAWSVFLIVRWGMAMGIALLALCVIPGQETDPERVMPTVLRDLLPIGVRGLVIAGLLAAFMSTFSSTVNSGAAYIVRDIWQPLRGSRGGGRPAMRASYVATLGLVAFGIAAGARGESIHQVWQWMMMALTGGLVIPNVLRWHWWRLNGWGFTIGSLAGALPAFLLLLPDPYVPALMRAPYGSFPVIVACSCAGCVLGSLATRPTDRALLSTFYRKIKPFGIWGGLGISVERQAVDRLPLISLNVVLAGAAIVGCYLTPMFLVGHWYGRAGISFLIALVAGVTLFFTWYRRLPRE